MASDVVNKIKKLLRLAKSDNEHEAALAMSQAIRIAEKYNIAIEFIEHSGYQNPNKIVFFSRYYREYWLKNRPEYEMALSKVIADSNNCRVYQENIGSDTCVDIIGTVADIQIVDSLFHWVRPQVSRLILSEGHRDTTQFAFGIVSGIRLALEKAKREARSSVSHIPYVENAICRLDNRQREIDNMLAGLHAGAEYREYNPTSCWALGERASQKININKRVLEERS